MNRLRRVLAGTAAGAVAASGLSVLGVIAAPTASAEAITVDDASFTWGVSGYAQKGIFGPWTFKDLTGSTTYLEGSVTTTATSPQSEYVVNPVPATSFPTDKAGKTPNAVKFTGGTGTRDSETGDVELSWTGSYTVNAYPAMFNAPNEIYADPQLSLDGDGNGELTMEFTIGAGLDMDGNPTEPVELGRVPVMTYSEGAVDTTSLDSFRLTPDYQGVEVTPETLEEDPSGAQNRTCTTDGGATGWWGSWPAELVDVLPSFVRPHFYSTGCGGLQDNKPALPADVDLGLDVTGEVEVTDTTLLADGTHEVTVTGTGFDPSAATGTRPPLAGQPAGVYVVFGKFAEQWQPSQGAPSSTRSQINAEWATPGGVAPGTTTLNEDGTFEATVTVDKATLDAQATAEDLVNYGIYTYAGSGAAAASYETYTPLSFLEASTVSAASTSGSYGKTTPIAVTVAGAGDAPTGEVTLLDGTRELATAEVVDGAATLRLPASTGAGRRSLKVAYAGDDQYAASEASVAVTIAKKKAATTAKVAKRPTTKRVGRLVVRATKGATGKVAVVVAKGKKRVARAQARVNRAGVATFRLPRRAAGVYRVSVVYQGDANHTAARDTVRYRIAKPKRR